MQIWAKVLLSVLCAAASALFSGLILGYMSLDLLQLQLLTYVEPASHQDQVNRRFARRILPLRRDSNLLLSTLIVSNSMVNALMVLLLGDLLDMTWGFVVSTLVTALLGEIAPQAVFMKHALRLCGFFSAPLRVLVCLLFPFCKPLALLLDYVLGPSNQAVYSRQQLKALVDLQLEKGNVLTIDEAKILKGCLEMTSVVAESIMTPIESVVHIENGTTVTKEVVHNVAKAGFSTIPVITGGPDKSVTGFLGVKDLLLLDTAKSYRVMDLCDSIGKSIYAVDAENSVSDILPFFKGDSIHAVVVRKVFIDPQTSGDPIYKHVGIITVDDILRIMLQDYVTSGTESGRGGDELVKRRSEMQMRKHEKLNAMKTVHAFCLNAVAGIYPLPDPQAVLRALGLRECQENLDAVKARHVYLLKSGTLIPSGSMFVLLKGSVRYVDEEGTQVASELPYLIDCGKARKSLVTVTECELVEVAIDEEFKH